MVRTGPTKSDLVMLLGFDGAMEIGEVLDSIWVVLTF